MTPAEHKARHELLHAHFDELLADFISHGPRTLLPTRRPIIELLQWSANQTIAPDHDEGSEPRPLAEALFADSKAEETMAIESAKANLDAIVRNTKCIGSTVRHAAANCVHCTAAHAYKSLRSAGKAPG